MFELVSPCTRCKVTTLDPARPTRPRGDGEPLRTLAEFRRDERGKVTFGWDAVCLTPGDVVSVGEAIEFCERRPIAV